MLAKLIPDSGAYCLRLFDIHQLLITQSIEL
ncbi:Uncharacterised protein [Vibrio cholerae]|nr:Uncharacterised protein [Vibrio cholerae]